MNHTTTKTEAAEKEQNRNNRAGVVMVETIVALVLLAAFMTGACKLLMTHRHMSDMARAHYTAVNIAKNRLELVRTFDFNDVINFVESDVLVDASGFPDNNGEFRRSTRLTSIDANLVELAVSVEIRDRITLGFKGREEKLTTYFTQQLSEDSSVGSGVTPSS